MQAQREPKEGILSRAKLAPLHMSPATRLQSARHEPLPPHPWLIPKAKPTYAQVTKNPPCDPEKRARDMSCDHTGSKPSSDYARDPGIQARDRSCDHTGSRPSRDPTCDPGKEPPDQPRDWSATQSCALPRFGCTMRLLIDTWKTVGRINDFTEEITKTCFSLTN